jgi:endoglucanase
MVNKKLFCVSFIFSILLAVCSGKSEKQVEIPENVVPYEVCDYPLEPASGQSAFDYFRDEKIFAGWNLGNSLDSYSGGVGNETAWGNPLINQDLMNGVKAAGFDIIRIPVTWMGHIGRAPDHRVEIPRLRRVGEVVEMARKAGLKVIINLHHDGSTSSLEKEDGWLSVRNAVLFENEYNRITLRFTRLWEQIAVYFQNHGDWLIFESMNEIHDGGWGWSDSFRSNPQRQLDVVNKWNQAFTDTVRATGGNNASRFLVIPAYCTNPQQTLSAAFILPNDTVSGKQIVSFHYYDPSQFGIEGKRTEWGTTDEKRKVDDDFAPFKPKFINNRIPVIIGETGAVLQLYPGDPAKEATARQSRADYLQCIFATAKKYGLVPIYWDNGATGGNGEKFGLFDRRNGQPNSTESSDLIKLMINAVK